MTTMTNFSATAERIGKTTSEKRAVEAMANALGSGEKLEEDLDRGANAKSCQLCHYVDGKIFACAKCRFMKDKNSCANVNNVFADILDRIRKLRGEG